MGAEAKEWDGERDIRRRRRRASRAVDIEQMVEDPDLFKHTFRLTPVVFDLVLSKITSLLTQHRQHLSPRLQLCLFLEHMGHGLSQRHLCVTYGVTPMCVSTCVNRVCNALIALDLVKWPFYHPPAHYTW